MSTATVEEVRAFTLVKADRVKAVVQAVAERAPRLEDVSDEGLRKLAQIVTAEDLRDEMKKRVHQERINYQGERGKYIAQASRTGSLRTKDLYSKALSRMEAWCSTQGISPLELTPARADDWIESEKAQGRAPATVRLDVSGASALWTWLERRHNELRNPFRGTRARPAKKAARKLAVPQDVENPRARELGGSLAAGSYRHHGAGRAARRRASRLVDQRLTLDYGHKGQRAERRGPPGSAGGDYAGGLVLAFTVRGLHDGEDLQGL